MVSVYKLFDNMRLLSEFFAPGGDMVSMVSLMIFITAKDDTSGSDPSKYLRIFSSIDHLCVCHFFVTGSRPDTKILGPRTTELFVHDTIGVA
jgi:hypothetical protein